MAKYLGPNLVVAAHMINPATETHRGRLKCKYLSPVRSAFQETAIATMHDNRYGGTVRRRVWIRSFPRPSTTVGKKLLIVPLDVAPKTRMTSSHVFQSMMHSLNPCNSPLFSGDSHSSSPMSRLSLHMASCLSASDMPLVLCGKFGRTK